MDTVRRCERVLCVLGLAALFAIIWIPSACSSLQWRWLDERPWLVDVLMWSWLLGIPVVIFGGMWLAVKSHGLLCPHCRKPLTTRYPRVLSTGTCSHCGKSVIEAAA